jgi:hypothetical protein
LDPTAGLQAQHEQQGAVSCIPNWAPKTLSRQAGTH